jgi:hypothetical protein
VQGDEVLGYLGGAVNAGGVGQQMPGAEPSPALFDAYVPR